MKPMSKKLLFISLFVFLASLLAATAQSRPINSCERLFYTESKQLPGNYIAVPGGIPHGRLHSQKSGEDCWAQAITSLVEAKYYSKTGKQVRLSPEYNLFWHIYFQVSRHLPKYVHMREQYRDPDPSLQTEKLQKIFKAAYGLGPSRHVNVMLGFQIDVGAYVKEAISTMDITGVVPEIRYDQEISTDEKERRLENGLAHFIGNYLLKGKNIERYSSKHNDQDGINTALFTDLVSSLKGHERAITQVPLRPDQEFEYRNRITTPRKFLKDDLKFNPKDFRYLTTSGTNRRLALRGIAKSIRNNEIPVLIGMELFGEDDVWMKQQVQGLFSSATCGADCKIASGQHELMVVNYLFKNDPLKPTALIVQNSWGQIGERDINGNRTKSPKKMGHVLITLDYLFKNSRNVPWDLLINKESGSTIPEP